MITARHRQENGCPGKRQRHGWDFNVQARSMADMVKFYLYLEALVFYDGEGTACNK